MRSLRISAEIYAIKWPYNPFRDVERITDGVALVIDIIEGCESFEVDVDFRPQALDWMGIHKDISCP